MYVQSTAECKIDLRSTINVGSEVNHAVVPLSNYMCYLLLLSDVLGSHTFVLCLFLDV